MGSSLLQAWRTLARRRAYTTVVVATLALGIGSNAALVTLLDALVLQPLPYRDAERLVRVSGNNPGNTDGGDSAGHPEVQDAARASTQLEWLTPMLDWIEVTVVGVGSTRAALASFVPPAFLAAVAPPPSLGRALTADDDAPGAPRAVALLSHGLWQREFGADPGIVGRTLRVNGISVTVVGVMSADYHDVNAQWGEPTALWLPLGLVDQAMGGNWLQNRAQRSFTAIGKLAPGATVQSAQAELDGVMRELGTRHPDTQRDYGLHVAPLRESFFGRVTRPAGLLLAAGILLLLVVAINLAGLLLVRSNERAVELATRAALGADARALLRALGTEPLLLGTLGVLAALPVTWGLLAAFRAANVIHLPGFLDLGFAWRPFLATVLVVGGLLGLAVAWALGRRLHRAPLAGLGAGRSLSAGGRVRDALVVAELALAVVLVVGAALAARSCLRLLDTAPGYAVDGLYSARLDLAGPRYRDPVVRHAALEALAARIAAVPGVSAAATFGPNLPGRGWVGAFLDTPERPAASDAERIHSGRHHVGTGALAVLGTPLLAGRDFDARDRPDAPPVAIVSRTLGAQLFPGADPIGRRLRIGSLEFTVIGVAADALHRDRFTDRDDRFYADGGRRDLYLAATQRPPTRAVLLVRSATELPGLREAVQRAVTGFDPELAVSDARWSRERLAADDALYRFLALALGGSAAFVLLIAALGVYGVLAHSVMARTREFGLRMAVGADRARIAVLVVGRAVLLVGSGVGLGLLGALGTTRLLDAFLFETDAHDLASFGLAPLVLVLVAGLATAWPTWRATRITPMAALRHE